MLDGRSTKSKKAALQVAPKLGLDVVGQRAGVVVSSVPDKRVEVLSHDGVKHGGLRLPTLVSRAGARLVDVERHLLRDGVGMQSIA